MTIQDSHALPYNTFIDIKGNIELFRKLYLLNYIAYASRNNEKLDIDAKRKKIEHVLPDDYNLYPLGCGKFQLLKSLQCILYQCYEEVGVKEDWIKDVFDRFERLERCLMSNIILDLPQYNEAKWE
jgi:hypothetical protein